MIRFRFIFFMVWLSVLKIQAAPVTSLVLSGYDVGGSPGENVSEEAVPATPGAHTNATLKESITGRSGHLRQVLNVVPGDTNRAVLRWRLLPSLPDTIRLSGFFAGEHSGVLIVAGGATPLEPVSIEGDSWSFHEGIYVLEEGASTWHTGFKLTHPLAYGASLSTPDGLLLIGGRDATSVYADVFSLNWNPETRTIDLGTLPPLPRASAFHAAAQIGSIVYIAAGVPATDSTTVTHAFWSLDLSKPVNQQGWQEHTPWPGPPRINAVLAVQSGGSDAPYVYLFDGLTPSPSEDGQLRPAHLRDGYRFDPAAEGERPEWTRINDLPYSISAGNAIPSGQSHLLVFGGPTDSGYVDLPTASSTNILAYHTITDMWSKAGEIPADIVSQTVVMWDGKIVLFGDVVDPGTGKRPVYLAEERPSNVRFGAVNYIVLAVYLGLLVLMGLYFARREKTTDDFLLAGKRIPWWAAGLSIYATQLSAITFISTPAVSFTTDWIVYPSYFMIFAMAPIVILFYVPFFRRLDVTTAYEYLEKRFSLAVRLFGSISFIVFQLVRMAIIVYLPALALAAITGIDIYLCIIVMGVLSIVYTVLGGMEAVIWTDVIQVIVLMGGLIIGLVLIILHEGGPGEIYRAALVDNKLGLTDWTWDITSMTTWTILIGSFFLQFGPYTTDQSVIQRYLTTKNEQAAARGIWLNGIMSVPAGLLFFMMGTCLYVFFKHHPGFLQVGMENDQIFPLFVAQQLPPGLSGLVIAGIFAASMSSLDSSMHSIATACTTDFYRRFNPTLPDIQFLKMARRIVVVVGVLAILVASILATYDIKSLFFFFQRVLGLISSGLAGIFILGIFTRRAHATGVLTGAVVSTAFLVYVAWFTNLNFYLYAAAGITVCLIVGMLASLVLPCRTKPLQDLTLYTQTK